MARLSKEHQRELATAMKIDLILKNNGFIRPVEIGGHDTQLNTMYLLLVYNLGNHLQHIEKKINTDKLADVLCQVAFDTVESGRTWI